MNNQRILESRNKREGGYLGHYRRATEHGAPRRYHRKGTSAWPTLREYDAINPVGYELDRDWILF